MNFQLPDSYSPNRRLVKWVCTTEPGGTGDIPVQVVLAHYSDGSIDKIYPDRDGNKLTFSIWTAV